MANPGLIKNALKRESWETLDRASTTNTKYNGLLGVITYHIKTICQKLKRIQKPKKKQTFTLIEQLKKLEILFKAKKSFT